MKPDLFNPTGRFLPPQETECCAYAVEIGLPNDEGSAFYDYQTSKGWKVGSASMKCWRAALRTWKRNRARFGSPVAGNPMQRAKQMGIG